MKKLTAVLIAVFLFPASFALGGEHPALANERPSLVNDDLAFAFHGDVPLRAQFMNDAEMAETQGRALPLILILAARVGVALAPHVIRAAKVAWQARKTNVKNGFKAAGKNIKIFVTHPKTKKVGSITILAGTLVTLGDFFTGGHLAEAIKKYIHSLKNGMDPDLSSLTPEQRAEVEAYVNKKIDEAMKKFAEENKELIDQSKNEPDSLEKFIEEYKKDEETPDEEETDSGNSTSTSTTTQNQSSLPNGGWLLEEEGEEYDQSVLSQLYLPLSDGHIYSLYGYNFGGVGVQTGSSYGNRSYSYQTFSCAGNTCTLTLHRSPSRGSQTPSVRRPTPRASRPTSSVSRQPTNVSLF
ncbi:MAG: hypothetical protein ISN29_08790 [Gammaproteobacteria bacterium AqS3]|nr:hypothetical protein [Gammaproteobacteria bacterium AqS3]